MKLSLFIRISIISILMIVPFVQASAQIQRRDGQKPDNRPRTASISGRITIAGQPAANAKVAITEVKDRNVTGIQDVSVALGGLNVGEDYSALTDADGRYRVTSLPEGKYVVRAQLGSCVREKPSPNESLAESVSLDEGESRENVDFALVRGGVITGRVTDANGRPLIARVISLQIMDDQGKKHDARSFQNMFSAFDMFQTDDRGVYRIFALRAGRYLVYAGGDSGLALVTGAGGEYPRTWHPDTTDENQAKVIEVSPGDEVTGVDIRLGVAKKTYEASGRVVDDETGKPVAGASVICAKVQGADESMGFGGFGGAPKTDDQGNFHISGLTPGKYQLSLADLTSFLTGGAANHYSDGARFEIQGADVAGVEIRAKRGATISGVAVIEDADQSAKSNLSQTIIMTQSRPSPQPDSPNEADENAGVSAMMPSTSRIGSDGGFSLKGIRPGKVTFQAFSITGGALQIVRIERDGVDMSGGIVVSGREDISGVRIVFGKGSGVIRGQVNVTGVALPKGWRMTVMAHGNKDAGIGSFGGFGGSAEVDSKGRFVIEGLLPGEYELILTAIPEINPNSPPPPVENMPARVTQKVIVTKGQEAQVTMTLDLSKKNQEEK
ncbi:MAG TPA: carboxypeptidase regulatory-like domain-containing protein [Blastocatellia bacterium]|nr:carboxypeptidase regulatory-like domain-containing protein [Blastocatellia bacterium]